MKDGNITILYTKETRSTDPKVSSSQSDRSSWIRLINILDQLSDASGITLAQSQTVHVPARLEQSGDPALLALPDLSAVITLESDSF